jgi:hypothetical protein
VSDWRWLQEREDSPWYPSVRLFRQRALNNWDDVIRRVAKALRRERAERLWSLPPVDRRARRGARRADLRALDAELRRVRAEAQQCEEADDFGPRFVELARAAFRLEAQREQLRRRTDLPLSDARNGDNGLVAEGGGERGRFGPGA